MASEAASGSKGPSSVEAVAVAVVVGLSLLGIFSLLL